MTSQAIPAFAITLPRSTDRRAALERHLESLSVEFERFDAVDGRLLKLPDPSRLHPECDIRPGQVGCCLSHFAIYERIVARRIPVACILEDDGRLRADGVQLLRHGCSSLDFDLCFLDSDDRNSNGVVCFDPDSGQDIAAGIRAYTLSAGPHSTHAYLVTAAAAEKRLAHALPIREAIDCYEFVPFPLRFRAVLPRAAFVSVLSRASLALDRTQPGSLPLYRWRGARGFYAARDILKGRALARWWQMWAKRWRGDLSRTGRWRPLPAGREIMPE